MNDRYHNQSHDDAHDDGVISSADINQAAANAFKHGAEAMGNAELGKTKKFMGVVTLDAGVADMLDGIYNVGADFLSNTVRPRIGKLVETNLARAVSPGAAKTAGIVASVGSTVVLKAGAYFGPIWDGVSDQRKQMRDLVHTIAPVLDDIKGNHSIVSLYTTGIKDNEVIFAHRKRLGKIAESKNLSNVTNLFVNSGASLMLDISTITKEIKAANGITITPAIHGTPEAANHNGHEQQLPVQAFKSGIVSMLPQLAKHLSASSEHKLCTEMQPYSALEMIVELSEQVGSDPKARGFIVPRSFQTPHGRREQYPLEEYLMRICIQHQKDMSYLDPKYAEIREALRDDLAASVKPLAAAIRKGDFNVMGLVRMVGEGKIIKKQGRAIASAAEVEALIEKEAPKQAIYTPVDPNEYYKDATFSRAQMKSALKLLSGNEKAEFAALFPDSILTEAGMAKDDVKSLRQSTAARYDHMLAAAIVGLNEKTDDVLKTDGLAHTEIEQIRHAAQAIHQQGESVLHDLKTSAVNERGIEHLLANVIVHKPEYLGKMSGVGHAKLQEQAANDDTDEHASRKSHHRVHRAHGNAAQLN